MSKPTKQKLRNIHPGEVLREEFLIPLGITQYRLAKEISVTEARISAICSGKRAITALSHGGQRAGTGQTIRCRGDCLCHGADALA